MKIELEKKELEMISNLLDCPYRTSEHYKSCNECEYQTPRDGCEIDIVTWKIHRALN